MTIVSIYPIRPQHLFYIALFRQTEIVGRVILSTLFAALSHTPTHHNDEDEDGEVTVLNDEPAEEFAMSTICPPPTYHHHNEDEEDFQK